MKETVDGVVRILRRLLERLSIDPGDGWGRPLIKAEWVQEEFKTEPSVPYELWYVVYLASQWANDLGDWCNQMEQDLPVDAMFIVQPPEEDDNEDDF